jgi:glycosyltransferase involved in cell wall biosynthesis
MEDAAMKQRILQVLPNLRHGSAARQAALLAAGLPGDRFDCRVVSLDGHGPAEPAFTSAGVPVEAPDGRGSLDPRTVWALRKTLAEFDPHVVNAWQPAAVRALHLARIGLRSKPAVVVSRPLCRQSSGMVTRFDAWLLRAADRVAVHRTEEAERCLGLGVPRAKIQTVHAGMVPVSDTSTPRPLDGVAPGFRYVACVGPMAPHKNLKMTIWAFGVLDYLYNDLHLLLIGSGPELARLRKFAADVGVGHLIHFLGDRADLAECFTAAEVAWVTGSSGGTGAILSAMAAGRPIIAERTRETAELLGDGEMGRLIAPNDPAELARQTRALLDDSELRHRLGETGRRRIAEDFSPADMVRDYARIYDEVAPNRASVLACAG